MNMLQVIIVDDDLLFRQEIRAVLEQSGDCIVVGESTTPTEVIALAQRYSPAIVLLNGDLTTSDALEIAWLLCSSVATVGIIVLTRVSDEERLFQWMKVGAHAYKTRTISPEELVETVRRVSAGEFLFSFDSS
jgi:DNA-binding NarL/FixJ family response regulator